MPEILKFVLISIQSINCSKKIFESLESEYCLNYLLNGIISAINNNQIEIVEQGLLVIQRLTSEKTLVYQIRKEILDMCKLVKQCIKIKENDDENKFRFILIN